MKTAYPILIKKNENDYLVYVPDLEIYTEGKSHAEAIEMARDAIGLKGISMEDDGKELPEPSDYDRMIKKAKADADEDFDEASSVCVRNI